MDLLKAERSVALEGVAGKSLDELVRDLLGLEIVARISGRHVVGKDHALIA